MGSTSVKFGKFKWNRSGYGALMSTSAVLGVLRPKAEAVKRSADASLSKDGYRYPGHVVEEYQGKLGRGFVVRTKTDHARYAQAKRKNLSKALGSAKG